MSYQAGSFNHTYNHIYLLEVIRELRIERHDDPKSSKERPDPQAFPGEEMKASLLVPSIEPMDQFLWMT